MPIQLTIRQRKCIQEKMGLGSMSRPEAMRACGVKTPAQAQAVGGQPGDVRVGKKKGGPVKAKKKVTKKKAVRKSPTKKAKRK